MNYTSPKKRFGQHFLKDPNILNKIANEVNPKPDDFVLEIGPGYGALTEKLFPVAENFTAVEIDHNAARHLRELFKKIDLIENDFLEIDFDKIIKGKKQKLRVVGNIPYNLTSPILFKLFENKKLIDDAVLMVQYEVAKRITANKDTKDYGILSVLTSFFTDTKLCFKISPNVFYPKPKVNSALIHLYFKEINYTNEQQKLLIKIVKAAFGKRRKILKNSLSNSIFNEIDFAGSGIDLTLRAENLTVEDFLTLTNYVLSKTGHSRLPTE
ncbi:MAG: 16S rRNA (adenine(1518)-N(6)/adenine(1519)-N(6))-dimethyltransferase RsmA [Ignavibacteria bacterium]|nr:16S rRNA (adenine(1518)-N(6)/adenine(1519)-N(6))-dimethyltransferase RsmA [Ignavibacteria bacterium]MBT8383927.1 16S rRNA (adenine(1518)-N(6)/adenine(1519)-N(6))-dimethyltransferase RsmA [Ignavibacteria bacterium]MBT8391472.1 16S rRNA (adenine(1518)-N(6)/adenine(1519)-N(6))-dimethyltransferase RsmA [Ignavibacteria bacterium]NNJ54135.1 16S rRNA (adenine(1518)-N(6)/adenine(1519)-N(6))-dimethyltransferase RsmA [Ignavibacteriaceae bacterium]NNL21402.1 16S rRNA (adenine(1518)-N(6)/adenine(1519)-N